MSTKKWTFSKICALVLSVGLVLGLMGVVCYGIAAKGYDQGKYTEDQLPTDLFDFFDALSGRRSDYKKEMMSLQSGSFIAALAVCIPCAILLLMASKKKEHVGLITGGGTIASATVLTLLLTIRYYSFSGSPRVAVLVLFFVTAVLFALLMAASSRHLGLYALALLAFSLAAGFLAAVYLSQILGLAAVILRELFWIAAFALMLLGGGSSGTVVYVIFI